MNDGRRVPCGKYSLTYYTPTTYLPRNKQVELKGIVDKKGFLPDGPIYTVSKGKRQTHDKPISYGKDGKEPPHSYLKFNEWKGKPKGKVLSKSVPKRRTYIDEVIEYNNKHKYPGPSQYFKENKKKEKGKVGVDGKKLVRPCFLDDPQYLGMNNPGPGAYKLEVNY